MNSYVKNHCSVLVNEVVRAFSFSYGSFVIDATFGGGGHSKTLLENYPDMEILGIDWDKKSLEQFGTPLQEQYPERFHYTWGNFAHLYKIARKERLSNVDGILADFGTSQMQIFEGDGFSFQLNSPLDMRMSHGHYLETAADIINTYSENDLANIFWDYAQEINSKRIARAIVQSRQHKKIYTTGALVNIIVGVVPWSKKSKIHPATKVFQALRIVVNRELENINAFLHGAFSILGSGGRLVCISFHSLEDRLVKDFFRDKESLGVAEIVTRKVIIASDDEVADNPSARSAKMRILKKIQ